MKTATKKASRRTARKAAKKKANPIGVVKRNKWFDAKKVRVKSTSKGPVIEIRQ